MSKYLLHLFGLLFLLLGLHQVAWATHARGIDLTYTCIDNNTYEIQLDFYFDCTSGEIPSGNAMISIESQSCEENLGEVFLFQDVASSGIEVSPLCALFLERDSSTCLGGNLPGVMKYVYKETITLPTACEDWRISYSECCRDDAITNLNNPADFNLYTEAFINNTNDICNNSPTFSNIPTPFYCLKSNTFLMGTFEPDGDDLTFELVNPLAGFEQDIPYNTGFQVDQPLNANSFSFDPIDGSFTFIPKGQEFSVVSVLVEEYRDGVFVGAVRRDIQVVVLDCENNNVRVEGSENNPTGNGPQQVYETCPGNLLTFDIIATDEDAADVITLSSTIQSIFGASLEIDPNATNPLRATFNWTPTNADVGTHLLAIQVTDNACPIASNFSHIFQIIVSERPDAGADQTYCAGNGGVVLEVTGGSSFTWEPANLVNFLNPTGSAVLVDPSTTTTFTVTNECGANDNVLVRVVDPFPYTISPDQTICPEDAAVLAVSPSQAGNYNYNWLPTEGLSATNTPEVTAMVQEATTYYVTITDTETDCALMDSVRVDLSSTMVDLWVQSDQTTICNEAVAQLAAGVSIMDLQCGVNNSDCLGNGAIYQFGNSTTSTDAPTPYNGIFEDGKIQILYEADDLRAAGMIPGVIQAIGFNILDKGSSTIPFENYTIQMACTDLFSLNNFSNDNLVTVVEAQSYTSITGWNLHTLDYSFDWDGSQNLLISICYDNERFLQKDAVAYTSSSQNTVVFAARDGDNGCNLTIPTVSQLRPDLQMEICPFIPNDLPDLVEWAPAESLDNPTSLTPIATPSETTTYTVTITDNNCTKTGAITVEVATATELSLAPEHAFCEGNPVTLNIEGANLLDNATIITWTPADALSCADCIAPQASPTAIIEYTVRIVEPNGCETMLSTTVEPKSAVDFDLGEDIQAPVGLPVTLDASGPFIAVTWTPTDALDDPTSFTPTVTTNTTQTYTAMVTTEEGCVLSDVIRVIHRTCDRLVIPSAFSPNADGMNDVFRIPPQGIDELTQFSVFNRWGELQFQTTDLSMGWDGTFDGQTVPLGTYIWTIEVVCKEKAYRDKGSVLLMR